MQYLNTVRKKAIWIFLLVLFLISGSIFDFVFLINRNLSESVKINLAANTNETVQQIESNFSNRFRLLVLMAGAIGANKIPLHSQQNFDLLTNMDGAGEMANALLINLDGLGVAKDGRTYSVSGRDYFQHAIRGRQYISDLMTLPDGNDYMVFAVPIYQDGEVIGALSCPYDPKTFLNMLEASVFNGRCDTYLLRPDGSVIVQNAEAETSNNFSQFLRKNHVCESALRTYESDLAVNEAGVLEYKRDGTKYYARYVPTGRHGWMLVNAIRSDVLDHYLNAVFKNSFILAVKLLLIILGFIIYAAYSWHKWKRKQEQAESKCNWLISALPMAMLSRKTDEFYTIVSIDASFERMTGYETSELMGESAMRYMDLVYPPDRPYVFEQMRRKLSENNAFEIKYRLIKQDGALVWVKERAERVNSEEIRCVLLDITAEKEKEAEGFHAVGIKNMLLKLSEEMFFVHTLKTGETEFSMRYQQFFGQTSSGDHYIRHLLQDEVVHPEDHKFVMDICDTIKLGKGSFAVKLRIKDVRGTYQFCKVNLEPIFDGDKRIIKVVGKIETLITAKPRK